MQSLLIPDAAAAAVAPSSHHPPCGPRRVAVRATDPKRRVVVTGMGVVSVFGNDVGAFYDRLLAGQSGVFRIDRFDASGFSTRFAAQIRDYSEGLVDGRNRPRLDDCQRYALVAAKKALESAALAIGSKAMKQVIIHSFIPHALIISIHCCHNPKQSIY
ncbi:hypothetical protein PR202_ga28938 [Eleusine coracana subsp. coracana]|uniref:beta-ketoacyl-[acyl-carrier-protein] synthase I n=1 Tax=Eleusine coracana subsp. coracana TaxID=191504 RepID=A0AAV5DKR9_ELECO|nr:hypothetical protein QOZ80_7AG0580020 [Eleusine coracana subsp. coracana]GJN10811.1 hypothetical protein PR202_ga28938 [Eleusine coracana subsp. coracana]